MMSPSVSLTKCAGGFCLLAITYIIFRMIPLDVLFVVGVTVAVFAIIAKRQWKRLRQNGLISYFSGRTQDILLKRSILDVFSDLLYFPYLSEILKAFALAVVQKPPPERLFNCFADLPPDAREVIATKGVLHLAPSAFQNLVLKEDWRDVDPDYGKVSTNWYNYKKYEVEAPKRPRKATLKQNIVQKIIDRPWRMVFLVGLATILASKKWGQVDIRKILARRGFQIGVIMCVMSLIPFVIRKEIAPALLEPQKQKKQK